MKIFDNGKKTSIYKTCASISVLTVITDGRTYGVNGRSNLSNEISSQKMNDPSIPGLRRNSSVH